MSFSNHARRVRDPSLPHGKRVGSLRSCVVHYQPLGWHCTLSFLEAVAGPFQHDEDALLRALDILDRSRLARHAAQQRYAERRRREKRDGHRIPRRDDPDPATLHLWFGDDARAAALHALRHGARLGGSGPARVEQLRASSVPGARELAVAVDECLATGGELTDEQRRRVAALVPGLHDRTARPAVENDADDHRTARTMLTVAGLLVAAGTTGAPYDVDGGSHIR